MAGGGLSGGAAAFWATRALEVVKRNDSPGLLWKRIKLTTTRKNNAKKRLKRLWQPRMDDPPTRRQADSCAAFGPIPESSAISISNA
uniref:Uncharacterized protein n=1 Tax=Triticum urartu TaxID=4572 RepID=A0A8R7UTM4_TRIUA